MFRFEEPAYLYLLLLLPFLAAFYLYSNYRRRRNIRRFGDPELLAQLMPDVSKYRPDVKFWLIFAAIGLFSVLLARPQFGSKQETVKRKGVEGLSLWIYPILCWHKMFSLAVWKRRRDWYPDWWMS